ncbi:MAG: thrombospondin type 3 repeat-containing protein [Patescibacteria group bacterium]
MKKLLLLSAIILIVIPSVRAQTATPDNVLGRILLQVEANGEAWYVSPETKDRYYLANGTAAYTALETFGLGITNGDLENIPIGLEERFEELDSDNDGLSDKLEEAIGTNVFDNDSDGDGYHDGTEVTRNFDPLGSGTMAINSELVDAVSGLILLQVESRGQAWYVNPADAKRYYMKDGASAYEIMRFLSLGITNTNLEGIPISQNSSVPPFESELEYTPWSDQIMSIDFSDYNSFTNSENQTVFESGIYKVYFPNLDSDIDLFGRYQLSQMKVCHEEISEYIGQDLFYPGEFSIDFEINEERSRTVCCQNLKISIWESTDNMLNKYLSDDAYWKDDTLDFNTCHSGHEETHRFFSNRNQMIPAWANEGLATYISEVVFAKKDGVPHIPVIGSRRETTCLENSYRWELSGLEFEYVDIGIENIYHSGASGPTYYTSACLWDYIDTTFGHQAFLDIMNGIRTLPVQSGLSQAEKSQVLINDVIRPITGSQIDEFLTKVGLNF